VKALVVALLLLLVACSAAIRSPYDSDGGCGRTFHVSAAFTQGERAALESAVARWNEIADEQFCLDDGDGNDEHGVFRLEGQELENLRADFKSDVIGVFYHEGGRIGIVANLPLDVFEVVALHEFGHAHGLQHTPPPSIMNAVVGTADDFTDNDLAECRRVSACLP